MEYKKISDIKLLDNNPRTISDRQFKILCTSIKKNIDYFEARPLILSDRTGELVVIAGNQRYKAAQSLGLKEVPTYLMKNLTEETEREIVIRDNISNGDWDFDLLANEWNVEELEDWGLEGFPFEEITELEAEEDDYTEPDNIQVDVVLGDLIEIGEHRLLCGDSTDSDQVAKLMKGDKADMVFTDPPYGNGSSGKYGRGQLGVRTILNDETFKVVDDFFNLRVCQSYVFFLQWRTFKEAIQTLENNNLKLKTIAVWDKKNAGLNGAGGMSEQWEAIIVAGDIKYSRFGGNVFNVSREQKKRIDSPHPHQKPIQLLSDVLEYFQDYKNLLDPFSGSGSTMVAAHQLKRKCYGMELDPKYCQVIIDRMSKLDPSLEVKINGVVYNK